MTEEKMRKDWVLVPREPTEEMVRASGGALKAYIDSLSPEERATLKPRKTGKSDNAGYNIRPQIKARVRWHAMIDAALSLPAPDGSSAAGAAPFAPWQPMSTAPKDGRTIEVRAVMHMHHMEHAKWQHMPWHWRPDTPQTEWRLTEWREGGAPSDAQCATVPHQGRGR